MDALKGSFARLLASTGLAVNTEVILIVAFALAVTIVAVGLALSRRKVRLETRLVDSEPGVVVAHRAVSDVLSDLDGSKEHLGTASSAKPEPSGELAKPAIDLGSTHKAVATNLPSTTAEAITDQESVQNYQAGIELLQTTLTSLQREQLALHQLLAACNAGLKGIEQLVAAIPSLRIEYASIKKQLAELNARFDAASELLAEFVQSEDPRDDR